jgi:hypothetical protein
MGERGLGGSYAPHWSTSLYMSILLPYTTTHSSLHVSVEGMGVVVYLTLTYTPSPLPHYCVVEGSGV